MAKRALPLVECLEDALLSYGYTLDEVKESLIRLAKHDEIYLELENNNKLARVIDTWLWSKGYSFRNEDFDLSFVTEEDIEFLTDFTHQVVLDIDPTTARRWVEKTIEYVSSPQYWKYARILRILDGVTCLPNEIIPPEVISQALNEAREAHYGDDIDDLIESIRRRRE